MLPVLRSKDHGRAESKDQKALMREISGSTVIWPLTSVKHEGMVLSPCAIVTPKSIEQCEGLSTSMHMQIADAAQKWIGVQCFKKEHYPIPDHAFNAASEQVPGPRVACHVCVSSSLHVHAHRN